MDKERLVKWILYISYSIACAISGVLIFYAAKNGFLYSKVLDHVAIKALILGIPALCCIIIDFHYHLYEMIEGPAWATSFVTPIVCLLIGYLLIGDKQIVEIFGISISAELIYILMYVISVVISYLAGLWSIFTGDEPKRRYFRSNP